MPQGQVLRPRRRADRIGLHEAELRDRAHQRRRLEQRTRHRMAAQVVEGQFHRDDDASCGRGSANPRACNSAPCFSPGSPVDSVRITTPLPVSLHAREPQPPARAVLEKALTATGKHGIDFEAQFVEQAGMQQRLDQPGAAMDADVATGLLLQRLDRVDEIAFEQRDIAKVSPPHVLQRSRCDVFGDAVDVVGKRLVVRSRPEACPFLVGDAPQQHGVFLRQPGMEIGLHFLAAQVLDRVEQGVFELDDAIERHEQVRNDLSHGKSSQVK